MVSSYETKTVLLSKLKEHPRQHEFFSEPSQAELEELAADIEQHGLQEPIHCCPDGTVVRSCCCFMALKLLGREEVEVVIRNDLSDPNSREAVIEMIRDYVKSLQHDKLALARVYRKLMRMPSMLLHGIRGERRDLIEEILDCEKSGKTLERYAQLLKLPQDIQDMFSRGEILQKHGHEILKLDHADREDLYDALRDGDPIPEVLREFGVVKPQADDSSVKQVRKLQASLSKNIDAVAKDLDAVACLKDRGIEVTELLDRAFPFCATLQERVNTLTRQAAKDQESCVEQRRNPDNLAG